jgi:hypothetical protein
MKGYAEGTKRDAHEERHVDIESNEWDLPNQYDLVHHICSKKLVLDHHRQR